ncbi:quinate utilization oxidoreductase QutH [Sporothrix brasiliensis 5110]|uniref:Quinate utilization oxidoreductase QutH n=1 Tax=Sporothrix brasiliensis 5110 TaxID=1398154 RepID=A0A0C2ICJ6_9PEZI|nr:quinate utilization oxidoreductase QutH [Sporothrix brasiliensis 5110]KIH87031.1 quinate utilization oxidoreductase QutH [Sporothrix brasiliensis 5110]
MTSNPKVTVVLVGGGTIAPLHAKYLQSSPNCELVAIIDPFPPGERLANTLGVPHYASVGDLLTTSATQPDAYIVCVPSHLHVSVASDILTKATPKAMLVEKPLATDSASAASLLEKARLANCRILVGHHRRFHPAMTSARETIEAGRIGRITAVSALWTAKKSDDYFQVAGAGWRSQRSAGGGPVWTNMVHNIDALHYLTGSRVVQLWAIPTRREREDVGQTVEEGAAVMARFSDGTVVTFVICDNTPSPFGWESASGDNPSYLPTSVQVDTYRIMGTRGSLSVPDNVLWNYDAAIAAGKPANNIGWNLPMTREPLEVPEGIPFQRQAEHLARVVRGLEAPRCSGEDGLVAVQVCEAILLALEAGNGVPVSLPA